MFETSCGCHVHFHRNVSRDARSPFSYLQRTFDSICICGGGPKDGAYGQYIGAKYWHEPGAFAHGFPGVCAVFVTGMSLLRLDECLIKLGTK